MAGGGGGGGEEGVAVKLEDAARLLVEHLVEPVLKSGGLRREASPTPEKQEAVARQVHAAVLLYNYFHRKQFPHLAFAEPKRFMVSASLAAGDALLVYLEHGGGDGEASVTDRAFEDACGIAQALDAEADSPRTLMWPISKVAVLLVDPTGKKCMIEHGSVTQGVWSILEKDITTVSGKSRGIDLSAPGSSHEVALSSEPYMLQQTANSLVESKTGLKLASLRFLEEHLVYSLTKKETTAKLFVMQYEQTVNSGLKEMPIEDLISRMSGPIFRNEAYPETTSVVEYYHILPYKEVLLNLLNREKSLDSPQSIPKEQPLRKVKSSFHSEIDESLKEQAADSKSNIKNTTTNASDPKKNKGMKEVGNSGTNCSTSKNRKNINLNCRRKSEALKATPKRENGSLSNPDAETLKLVSNAENAEATRAESGGLVDMETSDQMDKNKSSGGFDNLQTSVCLDKNKTGGKHTVSKNMAVDTIKVNEQEVDLKVKNHASENQIVSVTEISGSINVNENDQMYASLQSLQKMRDDIVREHCMLGDRSAQFDMDIQTILTEGKMTPRVISILKKYEENSSNMMKVASSTSSGEGSQKMKMKRKRLTEAVLSRTKCQASNLM
ncbi:hypothetical protein EJB05_21514 [Eragrostis curvula]|uniref:Uncharacterized protein n=1 Tax=Eragrostis curvula TaxID=38414 RepID=A0A5J9V3I2_9POAL|nr:hypothetical protein EJB05_21514 [Eragrostis curvula]